jgi:hypothetical protein
MSISFHKISGTGNTHLVTKSVLITNFLRCLTKNIKRYVIFYSVVVPSGTHKKEFMFRNIKPYIYFEVHPAKGDLGTL